MAWIRCLHVCSAMNRSLKMSFRLCSEVIHIGGNNAICEISVSQLKRRHHATAWVIGSKKYFHQGKYLASKVKNNQGADPFGKKINEVAMIDFVNSRMPKSVYRLNWKNHAKVIDSLNKTTSLEPLMQQGQNILDSAAASTEFNEESSKYLRLQMDKFSFKLLKICESDQCVRTSVIHSSTFQQFVSYVHTNITRPIVADGYSVGNILRIFGTQGIPDPCNNFGESLFHICKLQDQSYTNLYLKILQATSGLGELKFITDVRNLCVTALHDKIKSESPAMLLKYFFQIPEDEDCQLLCSLLVTKIESSLALMPLPVFVKYLSSFSSSKFKTYKFRPSVRHSISGVLHAEEFNSADLSDPENLLMACSKLKLYPVNFLSLVSDKLVKEGVQNPIFALNAARSLRWRHTELLDSILSTVDTCNISTLMRVTRSFAFLDYSHPFLRESLERELAKKSFENHENPVLLVDFVWRLSVLDVWIPSIFKTVLNNTFYESLLYYFEDLSAYSIGSSNSKMKQIQLFASMMSRGSDSQFILDLPTSPVKGKMHSIVYTLITHVFNVPQQTKYLRTNTLSKNGIPVDLEMIVNDQGVLQPINTADDTPGLHRIAVIGLDYFDMSIPEPQPLGDTVLVKRLLDDAGYKVVLIPYYEFYHQKSQHQLSDYFTSKVQETVGVTRSDNKSLIS